MIYRTAPFSMTLNDPYPWSQGHAILRNVRGTDMVSMEY